MLLEDFYTVVESRQIDESSNEFTVDLHKKHPIFLGHFPNFPVTPGVAMLQMIKNCLETQLSHELILKSASSIKFLTLVNPNEDSILIFNIMYSVENDVIKVKNSTSLRDGRSVLKCNVTFVKK